MTKTKDVNAQVMEEIARVALAIENLQNIYKDPNSSLCEMARVVDAARLLDEINFTRTITDWED